MQHPSNTQCLGGLGRSLQHPSKTRFADSLPSLLYQSYTTQIKGLIQGCRTPDLKCHMFPSSFLNTPFLLNPHFTVEVLLFLLMCVFLLLYFYFIKKLTLQNCQENKMSFKDSYPPPLPPIDRDIYYIVKPWGLLPNGELFSNKYWLCTVIKRLINLYRVDNADYCKHKLAHTFIWTST